MTGLAGEQAVVSALRRLAQDADVPPIDPHAERALLEAFDAALEQKRAPARRRFSRRRRLRRRCSRWRRQSRG